MMNIMLFHSFVPLALLPNLLTGLDHIIQSFQYHRFFGLSPLLSLCLLQLSKHNLLILQTLAVFVLFYPLLMWSSAIKILFPCLLILYMAENSQLA